MKNTNTRIIKGLKKVAGESKRLKNNRYNNYFQVNYDLSTKEIFIDEHSGFNHFQTFYNNSDIVNCGNIYKQTTMRELREMVELGIEQHEMADSHSNT